MSADEPAQFPKGRVPVAAIIKTAMTLLAASWSRAWPAWLALTVVNVGTSVAIGRMPGLGPLNAGLLGALLLLVQQGLLAVPAAAIYRALLEAPRPWAMDAAWRRFLAISLGVAAVLLSWLAVALSEPSFHGRLLLAWLLAFVGLLGVAFRLSLWPLANLMGKRVTWRSAWRQMGGASLSLSITMTVLCVGAAALPYALSNVLPGAVYLKVSPPGSIVHSFAENFVLAPVQWMMIAATAAVWRLRNGRGDGVAAVFD